MNIPEELNSKLNIDTQEIKLLSSDNTVEKAFGIISENMLFIQTDRIEINSMKILRNLDKLDIKVLIILPIGNMDELFSFLDNMQIYEIKEDNVFKLIYDSFGEKLIEHLIVSKKEHSHFNRNFFKKHYKVFKRDQTLKKLNI